MNKIDELKKLKTLLDDGAITKDEYESIKANIFSELFETNKTNNLSFAIEKSLQGDFKVALKLIEPYLYGVIDKLSTSRAFLYYTYCLIQNKSTIDEVKNYFKRINFTILKENYCLNDEQVLLKIGFYIIDIEYEYKFLSENFIFNDFFTENFKSELSYLYEKIIKKQFFLEKYNDSIHTIEKAKSLFPNDEEFKILEDEVKQLIERKIKKNKKIKKIVGLLILLLIIIISYTYIGVPYLKELNAFKKAKENYNLDYYENYLIKYPKGKYVNEVKKIYEQQLWIKTSKSDDEDVFINFIIKFPKSKFIKAANQKIKLLRDEENRKYLEMVFVEGGTFILYDKYEITIPSYYIGKYEVTEGVWNRVMGTGYQGKHFSNNEPKTYVSWNDIQEFIKKLNAKTGLTYRLPTEMEWVYAAKGGKKSKDFFYSGSNEIEDVAWNNKSYYHEKGSTESVSPSKQNVGTKCPNELDIYDMCGNVWELCQDWNNTNFSCLETSPETPKTIKGGSFNDIYCHIESGDCMHIGELSPEVGFRLILVK